jgi:hypothetical protein
MTKQTNKTTTRKPASSKAAPKKEAVETLEEAVVETVEKAVVAEVKPTRAKRNEIDHNELIACRNAVDGSLIYVSDQTRQKYLWDSYGRVQYLTMGELMIMQGSQPRFLNDVWLVIDDEEAAQYLGLTNLYESLVELEDLDAFFNLPIKRMGEILPKLPNGLKTAVATRARKLVEDKTLDSGNKIRLLEGHLNVELKMFEQK